MNVKLRLKLQNILKKCLLKSKKQWQDRVQDPLVELKQQELQLKSQDIQRKAQNDQQKLDLEGAKLDQSAKIAQDKIDSNEDIAQLRANVNLEKQNDKRNS